MSVLLIPSPMQKLRIVTLLTFALGLALFLVGLMSQDTRLYLILIIPVIETSSPIAIIGIGLMISSFFVYTMGIASHHKGGREPSGRARTKAGGIILIGPIPIIFASDSKTAMILMALSLAIILILIYAFIYF